MQIEGLQYIHTVLTCQSVVQLVLRRVVVQRQILEVELNLDDKRHETTGHHYTLVDGCNDVTSDAYSEFWHGVDSLYRLWTLAVLAMTLRHDFAYFTSLP